MFDEDRHTSVVPTRGAYGIHPSRRYIYLPGGGGFRCVWATVAFATLIHGFYLQWLAWGALHVATLTAEYWLANTFQW